MKTWRWVLPLVLVIALAPALGQEGHEHGEQGHEHGEQDHGHGHGEEGMSAEMTEEMQAWMALASPSEHHEHLEKMAGEWDLSIKMWMQPGAPVMESSGTSFNEMILDGRFLQSTVASSFMGQSFTGIGLDGYDNLTKKHVGMWIDNMSTMMLVTRGECSEEGAVMTNIGEFKDPVSGSMKKMKGVITLVNDDEFTYESWEPAADGEMFRKMEITYKRKS